MDLFDEDNRRYKAELLNAEQLLPRIITYVFNDRTDLMFDQVYDRMEFNHIVDETFLQPVNARSPFKQNSHSGVAKTFFTRVSIDLDRLEANAKWTDLKYIIPIRIFPLMMYSRILIHHEAC